MRFDACAHAYDTYAGPQRVFAALVADFVQVRSGEDILELGAGTGALTRHLSAKAGASLQATDASPAMVIQGRAAVPAAIWRELDAFQEPVSQASLQVSSGLLQWAEEPVRVLRRWREALKRDGRMVHAFPCDPCLKEWRAVVKETPVVWRDEATWGELFSAAGLQVRRKELWVHQAVFPTALDMVRALHRSGVTGRARLGPGQLRQSLRAYEAQYRQASGIVATWAWLAVEAVAG
ncbi:MAG TPA: methyltransferase [Candidatus Sulfotelmatobacter sp.]|nr:methyltransferase [Candidatus Sulfotelmatobacter sp.]HWI60175.1 methyltransferase [Bacillota bacterium]